MEEHKSELATLRGTGKPRALGLSLADIVLLSLQKVIKNNTMSGRRRKQRVEK